MSRAMQRPPGGGRVLPLGLHSLRSNAHEITLPLPTKYGCRLLSGPGRLNAGWPAIAFTDTRAHSLRQSLFCK